VRAMHVSGARGVAHRAATRVVMHHDQEQPRTSALASDPTMTIVEW
jgi:hypothetical protein